MMHDKRVWCVQEFDSVEAFANELITTYATCMCHAAMILGHPDYIFLNDSTSEDAVQEWAIVKGGIDGTSHRQIESLTVSWCDDEEIIESILRALSGDDDEAFFSHKISSPRLETPEVHDTCGLCG